MTVSGALDLELSEKVWDELRLEIIFALSLHRFNKSEECSGRVICS